MTTFGADEIRIGEALLRTEAHLAAACELYGMGRKADALLQAARPVTDVLPELEVEIRSAGEVLRSFFNATGQVGAAIRHNEKPRAVRRSFKNFQKSSTDLFLATIGQLTEKSHPEAGPSIAVALLERIPARYRAAVEDEDLGAYQDAYAFATTAGESIFEAHDGRAERLTALVRSLDAAFPSAEPPEKLARPDDVERLVEAVAVAAVEELGAIRVTTTLGDSLRRIDKLLGDVLGSYERGLGPLSARLAASLFVRSYDPIRRDLGATAPDAEARLTSLLGFELRKAINDGAPPERIRELATEAHELLVGDLS